MHGQNHIKFVVYLYEVCQLHSYKTIMFLCSIYQCFHVNVFWLSATICVVVP